MKAKDEDSDFIFFQLNYVGSVSLHVSIVVAFVINMTIMIFVSLIYALYIPYNGSISFIAILFFFKLSSISYL